MGDHWKYYAHLKKPVIEAQVLHDSTDVKCPEQETLQKQKVACGCLGLGRWGWELMPVSMKFLFKEMKIF